MKTHPGRRFSYAYDRKPRMNAAKKEMHLQALNELDFLYSRRAVEYGVTTLPAELPVCKCLTIVQYSKSKLGESEDALLWALQNA